MLHPVFLDALTSPLDLLNDLGRENAAAVFLLCFAGLIAVAVIAHVIKKKKKDRSDEDDDENS